MYVSRLLLVVCVFCPGVPAQDSTRQGIEFSGSMYADAGVSQSLNGSARGSADFSGTTVLAVRFRNVNRTHAAIEGDFELMFPYGAKRISYSLRAINASVPNS
jgi:hypothetical protein